jgi:hypothetical protein
MSIQLKLSAKALSSPGEIEELRYLLNQIERAINSGLIDVLTLHPQGQPSGVSEGYTYYDSSLKKVRTWDGTSWQNHW